MQTEMFPIEVRFAAEFLLDMKHLAKKFRSIRQDLEPLVDELTHGATPGDRVKGVEGYAVYKERLKNTDLKKGKSAGYRVVYCVADTTLVVLLSIYAKTEQADISPNKIIDIIKDEGIVLVEPPEASLED
jgi:mRNA-degrading endonuclease RelE of RelBE toxin-antitoxin system